jgi:hypothetical protein
LFVILRNSCPELVSGKDPGLFYRPVVNDHINNKLRVFKRDSNQNNETKKPATDDVTANEQDILPANIPPPTALENQSLLPETLHLNTTTNGSTSSCTHSP